MYVCIYIYIYITFNYSIYNINIIYHTRVYIYIYMIYVYLHILFMYIYICVCISTIYNLCAKPLFPKSEHPGPGLVIDLKGPSTVLKGWRSHLLFPYSVHVSFSIRIGMILWPTIGWPLDCLCAEFVWQEMRGGRSTQHIWGCPIHVATTIYGLFYFMENPSRNGQKIGVHGLETSPP